MLRFTHISIGDQDIYSSATLTFDQRTRSRQKVELDNGETGGLFLPRGTVLQQGQRIAAESGEVVEIRADVEAVSTVRVSDPLLMARACYHLGNRHVALQITDGLIRYQHDHVLDEMVRGMGLAVDFERAPFEPEAGAYAARAHGHSQHEP